jgi:hypothetical protein
MARQYGTDRSVFNTLSAPLLDPDGLPIVDTGTGFGSSPLGISLREQIQFGLPNATFNLLPPDPAAAISEGENPLPFWQIQTTPNITATATYDTTTQTWGVKVDPGTAPSGDYIELKTRSWVTTDDNIALRQIASLTASKGGTYAGTTQWNLTLSAAYYDAANTALGTTVIGTVYDNTTWTSISGTTTSGGSAISSSAAWAEFTIKLTTTAAVSSSTFATLKSLLIATSTPAGGGGNFVVTETFTSSGTWTRPTGVDSLLAVVGIGAGGGGGGGGLTASRTTGTTGVNATAGNGGGGGRWAIIRDLYVANAGSVTIGIGSGGVGGTANTFTKAAASTTQYSFNPTAGGDGGATTFGSYLSIPGGGGGGTASGTSVGGWGIPAGTITTSVYDNAQLAGGTGQPNSTGGVGGSASPASAFGFLSFTPIAGSGITGGASSVNYTYSAGGTGLVLTGTATAGGGSGYCGGGGGGQSTIASGTVALLSAGRAAAAGAGGGGGAGLHYQALGTVSSGTSSAGNGAAGTVSHGAGGGSGGAFGFWATLARYDASSLTGNSGAGGAGSNGVIYVVYVA